MKNSFILPLVIFASLVFLGFFLFNKNAQAPNEQTKKAASTIPKHPNSLAWSFKEQKNLCILTKDECSQPITISFDSPEQWNSIYGYYRSAMLNAEWSTNSQVFTSVPSGVVFTNENDCSAILKENSNLLTRKSPNSYKYSFRVVCNAK